MATTEIAAPSGFFQRLGDLVVRWPLLVIGFWIALAAVPLLTFPPLAVIAGRNQAAPLPDDAPVLVTSRQMSEAFHETGSDNMVLVVLTNEKGLGPADEQTYRTLVEKLRQDTTDVKMVQDFLSAPPLREILQSKDKKAWNLPVVLTAKLGAPESRLAYEHVTDVAKQTVAGSTLTANVTGPAATIADLTEIGEHDMQLIEIGTVAMVVAILLIVYRNPITMLLPLVTIGISLATAQGVLAGFAQLGLPISSQTIVLMCAVMIGAGVDYAVFLISRYHDYVRLGADSNQAVKRALASIGKVIAASAATVAVTFLAMLFSRLPVFITVGPAIAISIAVAFAAAATLLPAILTLAGPRGWVKPRRGLTNRFWRRSGIRIVRRPKTHLLASLIVLITLASCASLARYSYDDRKSLPGSVESAVGYAALGRHFSLDSLTPQFLFVQSPHDLRTPEALADLEQMARRVSQVPGIALVRGITRPTGEPLEQAKTTYQAGEVGGKLDEAHKQITNHNNDLNLLTGGADQLADSLGDIRRQLTQSMGAASVLVDALSSMQRQLGGGKTLNDIDNAAQLVSSMHALGEAIGVNFANVADSFEWVAPVLTALNASPICNADPSCLNSRKQLERLVAARNDGTLQKVADLSRQLQSTQDGQSLDSTVKGLRSTLATATTALQSLSLGGGLQGRLSTLRQGSNALADGSRRLAEGVQLLVDQIKQMGGGLGEASAFLLAMKNGATKPSMAGFYIPPQILTQNEFKSAAAAFISPDGHATRYIIQTQLDPFSIAAMDQVNSITDAARGAQPNTTLADAKISMVGVSAMLRDTRDYYNHDIEFFVLATIVIVLLILMVLLRAVVAALYLIGSVVISYMSALGLGVIVFQLILGQELHWSIPGLTFILLVAVGADYNLLLISRIRDESPYGVRLGVIRTIGSTGGVITSAGLIFAASMFGLMLASINTMAQVGFVIGIGILLDTFLVRTITVPAIAAIVGQTNWWPHQWWPRLYSPARLARRKSARHRLVSDVSLHDEQTSVGLPATVTERHRHRLPQNHEHFPRHALPLLGTHGVPQQPTTNGVETAVDDRMTTNGQHLADTNGQHLADTNGQHLADTNGERPATANGDYPAGTNGNRSADYTSLRPRHSKCNKARGSKPDTTADTPDLAYTKYGEHPAETDSEQPTETNGQHRAETHGHEPVKTPPVDRSSEDDRVNEPRWIGWWPANDATFPVGAHNGHQPATTASVAPSSEADRLR
jgi:putative drug exporter of the RND superfamily